MCLFEAGSGVGWLVLNDDARYMRLLRLLELSWTKTSAVMHVLNNHLAPIFLSRDDILSTRVCLILWAVKYQNSARSICFFWDLKKSFWVISYSASIPGHITSKIKNHIWD